MSVTDAFSPPKILDVNRVNFSIIISKTSSFSSTRISRKDSAHPILPISISRFPFPIYQISRILLAKITYFPPQLRTAPICQDERQLFPIFRHFIINTPFCTKGLKPYSEIKDADCSRCCQLLKIKVT